MCIYANSPGLFGSFPDTGRISWPPIRVTKSPGCEGESFKVHSTLFWLNFWYFQGKLFKYLILFEVESVKLHSQQGIFQPGREDKIGKYFPDFNFF